jgi:hypothetical protein
MPGTGLSPCFFPQPWFYAAHEPNGWERKARSAQGCETVPHLKDRKGKGVGHVHILDFFPGSQELESALELCSEAPQFLDLRKEMREALKDLWAPPLVSLLSLYRWGP